MLVEPVLLAILSTFHFRAVFQIDHRLFAVQSNRGKMCCGELPPGS